MNQNKIYKIDICISILKKIKTISYIILNNSNRDDINSILYHIENRGRLINIFYSSMNNINNNYILEKMDIIRSIYKEVDLIDKKIIKNLEKYKLDTIKEMKSILKIKRKIAGYNSNKLR